MWAHPSQQLHEGMKQRLLLLSNQRVPGQQPAPLLKPKCPLLFAQERTESLYTGH
jgi:hypothetical protein